MCRPSRGAARNTRDTRSFEGAPHRLCERDRPLPSRRMGGSADMIVPMSGSQPPIPTPIMIPIRDRMTESVVRHRASRPQLAYTAILGDILEKGTSPFRTVESGGAGENVLSGRSDGSTGLLVLSSGAQGFGVDQPEVAIPFLEPAQLADNRPPRRAHTLCSGRRRPSVPESHYAPGCRRVAPWLRRAVATRSANTRDLHRPC